MAVALFNPVAWPSCVHGPLAVRLPRGTPWACNASGPATGPSLALLALAIPSRIVPWPRVRHPLVQPQTQIDSQKRKFDEAAFRGERFADYDRDIQGNNDVLSLTQPDAIREIHT